MQIAAFAGAPFYSLGPGFGKRGRRGVLDEKAGLFQRRGRALRTSPLARCLRRRSRHLGLQQKQQAIAEPIFHLPIMNG